MSTPQPLSQSRAACRSDPDAMFVDGKEQHLAKEVCTPCPLRPECLAEALQYRIEFGVWGGMTERERRALLRRHPHVDDWAHLLRHHAQPHQEHPQARAA